MKEYIRTIIKEALNSIFEVQEVDKSIISNLLKDILNSEIGYKSMMPGLQKFTNETEIKEEIKEKVLSKIRDIQKIAHVATDSNRITKNVAVFNPKKDSNEYLYSVSNMYLYKLDRFKALENDEYKNVVFDYNSLSKTISTSKDYIVDSTFIIVYNDSFFDYGFFASFDSDINLKKYMEDLAKNKNIKVGKYIIVDKQGDYTKLHAGKEINYTPKPIEKPAPKLNALNKGALSRSPNDGWGQIESYKHPYLFISFPKKREDKIFTDYRPIVVNKGKKTILTKDKMKSYLDTVGKEIKKFDAEKLFMNSMRAKHNNNEL